jgi:hypothetical protein
MKRREIVQSKTGCLTCRKRRKKCDERKPTCWNCERNRLECDGYQAARPWKPHATGPNPTNSDATAAPPPQTISYQQHQEDEPEAPGSLPLPGVLTSPLYRESTRDTNPALRLATAGFLDAGRMPMPDLTTPTWADVPSPSSQTATSRADDSISDDSTALYFPIFAPITESSRHPDVSGVVSPILDANHRKLPRSTAERRIALPSIVNGIDSATDKRLLHHFTQTLARLLVTTAEPGHNPFIHLILPLAMQDGEEWGMLDLILSLSASHLFRLLQDESNRAPEELAALDQAKWKHYSRGVTRHAKRLSSLMIANCRAQGDSGLDELQIDYAMATTMLLCQWSTCEGGDQSNWRIHLSANRDLVRRKFDRPASARPAHLSATSQTLLEWFYFHDVIAMLTFPDQSCCINLEAGIVEAFGMSANATTISKQFARKPRQQIMWIGPNDGLLALISRILALRKPPDSASHTNTGYVMQGMASTHGRDASTRSALSDLGAHSKLDSDQLVEALAIESAIEDWDFEYETPQQRLVGQCYRLAAFLLLFFTVNPKTSLKHAKVQTCLDDFVTLIRELSPVDNAITCTLLPLFICGVSAINIGHRNAILSQMDVYRRWSGLGHVCDVIKFLREWWQKQDLFYSTTVQSHHHYLPPDLRDGAFEPSLTSQAHPGSFSWWAWRNFMGEKDLQLILI